MNKKNICNLSKKIIAFSLSTNLFATNVNGVANSNRVNQNLKKSTKIIENLDSKNGVSNSDKYLFLENSNKKVKTNTLDTVKETLNNCDKRNWIIGGTVTGVNLLLLLVNFSVNRSHVSQQQLSQRNTESHISDGEDDVECGDGEVKNNNLIKQKFKDFETSLDFFLELMSNPQMVWNSYSCRHNNIKKTCDFSINYNTDKYIIINSTDLWEQYKSRFANIIMSWNNFINVFRTIPDLQKFATGPISDLEINDLQNCLQYIPQCAVSFENFAMHLFNGIEENNCFNILSKFVDSKDLQRIIGVLRTLSDSDSCVDLPALLVRTVWTNHLGKSEHKRWQTKIFRECKVNFIPLKENKEFYLSETNKKKSELYQDLKSFVGQDIELIKKFIKAFENFRDSSNWSKSAWYDCISTKYTPSEENDHADACFTAFKELENCMNMDSFGINENYKDNYYNFYNSAKNCYNKIRNILNIFNYFELEKASINLDNIENIKCLVGYMSEYLLEFYKHKTKKINNKEISFNNLVYIMNEICIDIKKIHCDFEFNIIKLQ